MNTESTENIFESAKDVFERLGALHALFIEKLRSAGFDGNSNMSLYEAVNTIKRSAGINFIFKEYCNTIATFADQVSASSTLTVQEKYLCSDVLTALKVVTHAKLLQNHAFLSEAITSTSTTHCGDSVGMTDPVAIVAIPCRADSLDTVSRCFENVAAYDPPTANQTVCSIGDSVSVEIERH